MAFMFPADIKERTEIIQRHLDAVRYHPDLMYDGPVEIEDYDRHRIDEAFKIQLPFADTHLPIILIYGPKLRLFPELYILHDDWKNFWPRYEHALFAYNVQEPQTTVDLLLDIRRWASIYQLDKLRRYLSTNLMIGGAGGSGFDAADGAGDVTEDPIFAAMKTQREIMPDNFQVIFSQEHAHVAWTIQFPTLLPQDDGEDDGEDDGGDDEENTSESAGTEVKSLLFGVTKLGGDFAQSKAKIQQHSEVAAYLKSHNMRFYLPKILEGQTMESYVSDVETKLQDTLLLLKYRQEFD